MNRSNNFTTVPYRSALMALLPLLALACQDGERPESVSDTAAVANASADRAAQPQDTVQVTLDEWFLRSARDTLAAGSITFRAVNEGEYEHAFEVEGQGIEEETEHIAPGQSRVLTVNLQPGTYTLYCPVEDTHGKHEQLGMRTSINVR